MSDNMNLDKNIEIKENCFVNENEIDLYEIIKLMWINRKLFIWITSVCTIIGVIYALLATPYFRSTSTLYQAGVDQQKSRYAGLASALGMGNILGNQTSFSIKDVVFSNKILEQVIYNRWKTDQFGEEKVNLIEYWQIEGRSDSKNRFLAIKRLKTLLNFSISEETGLITISVLSKEPLLASDIVNFITDKVNQYILKEQNTATKQSRIFIEKRLSEVKKELNQAEDDLKKFVNKNRDFLKSPELQLEYNRLKREVEIKNQSYLTIIQQREVLMIEEAKDTPIINILDKGVKPEIKAKPKRSIIVIIFFILGSIISSLFILGRNFFESKKKSY